MQISYDELAGVDTELLDLLHSHDREICSVLARAGRQGWYRWRAVRNGQSLPAFDLVTDENPPARLARVNPSDLTLPSTDFCRVIWDRLN